jgi:hypothetical protein
MRFGPDEIRVLVRESDGRLLLSWRGSAFDELRDVFKASWVRHSDRSYNGQERAWSLPLARRTRLENWLDAYVEPEAITWLHEPAGHTYSSSGGTGYGHYDHHRDHQRRSCSTALASPLEQAYKVLHLQPTAPDALVTAAYHILARMHHPDTGHGDEQAMAAINAAATLIRQEKAS